MILFCFATKSWAQDSIPDPEKMCKLLSEMVENDKVYRYKIPDAFSNGESDYSQKEIDSMKILRRKIDTYNTEKLIELTQKYGWISNERIHCHDLNVWIIFRHSDKKYFPVIAKLIEKEFNAGRLNAFEYQLIKHHLQNRPRKRTTSN